MKRKNALIIFTVLTLLLLALDRVTKMVAIDILSETGPIVFIPGVLDFVLVYNTGGAFGLFEGGAVFFVGVAVIALIVIVAYLIKAQQLRAPVVVALALISAGALGNAYDRAIDHAVPDFIHTLFMEFPVFNVADICLTVGEIFLLVMVALYWFSPRYRQEEEQKDESERAAIRKAAAEREEARLDAVKREEVQQTAATQNTLTDGVLAYNEEVQQAGATQNARAEGAPVDSVHAQEAAASPGKAEVFDGNGQLR